MSDPVREALKESMKKSGLFEVWLRCKQAYDSFDEDARRGAWHVDICCCADCEAVRAWEDLPWWKRYWAQLWLGIPSDAYHRPIPIQVPEEEE